jgi:tRNA A-37 threonylcarbamoyl transferase component Bud32
VSTDLESSLRDLPKIGQLVKDRGYRQIWRFEHAGKAYFLKFYPKGGPRDRFRRFFRGSPAMREFTRLQALQKANIPAPRAVAVMLGFTLNGRFGDVVILHAIEPSVQLDHYLTQQEQSGRPLAEHRHLAEKIRTLVHNLGKAGLGHADLHLGNFLLHDGNLFLLDGYAVRTNGLHLRDIQMLEHSVRRRATRTDLLRGWYQLGPGGDAPQSNPLRQELWNRFLAGITKENRYFGKITIGPWQGIYYKHTKYPSRWSAASQLEITKADWEQAWPKLLAKFGAEAPLKRTLSGEVFASEIQVAGRTLEVIVKRPRRRYWYRYINEIGRGSRPRRAWKKSWNLIVRGLPTAFPLLLMERRRFGYVTDAVIVYERIPGKTLGQLDLDTLSADQRDNLMRRAGRILRQIEQLGFSHFDAKSSNWIVFDDSARGPSPVLIDIDGIRRRRWIALGIERLLRSMKENPKYTPQDSLSLCSGYAPFARLTVPEAK